MSMQRTEVARVMNAAPAPPYLEDEGAEMSWLRADLAGTVEEVRDLLGLYWGLEEEDISYLEISGPRSMQPDPDDEYGERWKSCSDDEMQARYWQVSP